MIFFCNQNTDPAFNLALEEILAAELADPFFMLWRNRPSIIVGRNQNTAAEIDGDFVREHHIDVVRRITGGGAVYHDLGNINYTIAADRQEMAQDAFAHYAAPVVGVLRKMGVDAEFSGRNDIIAGGRKISGSAKSILQGRTLFHGTLLFDTDLEQLTGALRPDAKKISARGIKSVRSRVMNLREMMPELTVEDFLPRLQQELLTLLEVDKVSEIPAGYIARAEALAETKYRTWQWNYGVAFEYDYEKSQRFGGGTVCVSCRISENRISALRFSGDFFGKAPAEELAARLTGCEFRRESIAGRISAAEVNDYFQGVTEAELLSLFE